MFLFCKRSDTLITLRSGTLSYKRKRKIQSIYASNFNMFNVISCRNCWLYIRNTTNWTMCVHIFYKEIELTIVVKKLIFDWFYWLHFCNLYMFFQSPLNTFQYRTYKVKQSIEWVGWLICFLVWPLAVKYEVRIEMIYA